MTDIETKTNFPIGCEVYSLFNLYGSKIKARVVGYKNDVGCTHLVVEGIHHCSDLGKAIADPSKTLRLSKGHLGIAGKFEYFFIGNDLYRALTSNYIDVNGYRVRARFQMKKNLMDGEYLTSIGFPATK